MYKKYIRFLKKGRARMTLLPSLAALYLAICKFRSRRSCAALLTQILHPPFVLFLHSASPQRRCAVCFVCLRVTVSLCALYVCLRVTVLLCALYVCVSQCLGRGPPKTLQRLPLYLYHLLPVCRTPSFKFQNKMPFVKYSGAASFACSVNIVTK